MTTERAKKDKNYSVVSNEPINDARLSWGARGLLVYLLSKPDDWVVRPNDIMRRGPARELKVTRMLAELKRYGYLSRRRIKRSDGTFNWVTTIYESPALNPEVITIPRLSKTGFSRTGSSRRGKPHHILSTELPITQKANTEEASTVTEREGEAEKDSKAFSASPSLSLKETEKIEPKYVAPSDEVNRRIHKALAKPKAKREGRKKDD
jgi:hypothetical protein